MRSRVFVSPILLLALGFASCPDSGPGDPGEAFDAVLGLVRAGDFDGVWLRHAEEWRQRWSEDMQGYDRIVHEAGQNLEAVNQFLSAQFGMTAEPFLRTSPRRRFTAFLEVNRDRLLRYRRVGPAQVEGDRAWLKVEMDPEIPPQEWVLVLRAGEWRILETPDPARGK